MSKKNQKKKLLNKMKKKIYHKIGFEENLINMQIKWQKKVQKKK